VRAGLTRARPPKEAGPEKLAAWAEGWCTLAWHAWQAGRKIDAQEALRAIQELDPEPARAQFLRGEIALKGGDSETARKIWTSALERGEDYRVRIALGSIAASGNRMEEAERHFLAAEKDFPGYDEESMSAELKLSKLYAGLGRNEDSLRALERRLDWDAGNRRAARGRGLELEEGRFPASAKRYGEANEIDPFRRSLHLAYGRRCGPQEAGGGAREFEVGPKVRTTSTRTSRARWRRRRRRTGSRCRRLVSSPSARTPRPSSGRAGARAGRRVQARARANREDAVVGRGRRTQLATAPRDQ
jgi:tetratricopeptide (TPR) repeat protein